MKNGFGGSLRALLFGAVATAAFGGCVRDGDESPAPTRSGELRISFSVDGMEANTRATETDPSERTLNDVHILFFQKDPDPASGNYDYITYAHASVPVGSSYFSFQVPAGLVANTEYRTLVVGNAHSHFPDAYNTFDDYLNHIAANGHYETIRTDLYAALNATHHTGTATGLPMWGEVQDGAGAASLFSFSGNPTDGYRVSVRLCFWRAVCRLDLQHLAARDLIIAQVKLCNFRKGGYYFHNDVPWGSTLGGINEGTWVDVAPPSAPTDPTAAHTQTVNKIYAYPNMVPVVTQDDKNTTYLMIAGYYQDGTDNTPDAPRTKLTYYRFNMAQNGRSQILRRNHIYKGIINRVSGPGASNESEAEDAKAPLLEYDVSDTWQDDDDSMVSDDRGNFLSVSRVMVSFSGDRDQSEVVKVKVKEGLSWSVAWDTSSSTVGDYDKFAYQRNDDGSFSILTREDNTTEFLYKARLIVTATGGTVDASRPLATTVDVLQLSSREEMKVLLVDNQVGTLDYTVPANGTSVRLQVQTGSMRAAWLASDPDNVTSSMNVAYTRSGANNGVLEIDVPANITAGVRSFSLLVHRADASGAADTTIDPVKLNFTQPKSEYLFTIAPAAPQTADGIVLEGFDPRLHTATTPNTPLSGVSTQQDFRVTLADPENYTYTVVSTFDKDHDLFLSKDSNTTATVQAQWTNNTATLNTITGLKSGEAFYVNVFRTGPGDPTFRGTITVTAVPNTGAPAGAQPQSVDFTITVRTSCTVDDALIPYTPSGSYLLVADRNVGTTYRINNGKFVEAHNFSNDANMEITGPSSVKENTYTGFKGEYHTWNASGDDPGAGATGDNVTKFMQQYWIKDGSTDGSVTNIDEEGLFSPWYKSADAAKWKIPTNTDFSTYILPRIIYSKQRAFIVSERRDATGNYVGCYFPFAGYSNVPGGVFGYYWSSTVNSNLAYYLGLAPTSKSVTYVGRTYGCSVRCVRPVTADEYAAAYPNASR